MPRILVTTGFKFAVDGLHVIEVEPGEQDVSERCAEVAVEHLQVASRLDGASPVVKPPPLFVGPVVTAKPPLVAAVVSETPPVVPPAPVKPVSPPKPATKPKAAAKAKPAAKAKANAGGAA